MLFTAYIDFKHMLCEFESQRYGSGTPSSTGGINGGPESCLRMKSDFEYSDLDIFAHANILYENNTKRNNCV